MLTETAPSSALAKTPLRELMIRERQRASRRRLVAILTVALVAASGFGVLRATRPRQVPYAARFRTQTLIRGDVLRDVSATGHLEAVTTVQVGAEISGRIASVEVDYNDHVTEGQVLARFDRAALHAQLAQTQARLAAARATAAQSAAEAERCSRDAFRAEQMAVTGSITEQARDERRAAARVAVERLHASQAEIAAQEAALVMARTNLDHATIHAPIDGVVITRNVDPGQTVASVLQTPVLFTVAADLRRMHVVAAVDEADIGEVEVDQPATFTVHAYPTRVFDARVTQVRSSPELVQDVVTYGVELTVDNDDLVLKPGMTASVRIRTAEARAVLRAPVAALSFTPPGQTRSSAATLWRLDDQGPHPSTVATGVSDGEWTQIASSASLEGARVLVELTPEGRRVYGLSP